MKFRHRRQVIEFLCRPEDLGVIAEPIPAKTALPSWLRKLPGVDRTNLTATNNGLTVKRCMPFLDAMTTGWLIPLAGHRPVGDQRRRPHRQRHGPVGARIRTNRSVPYEELLADLEASEERVVARDFVGGDVAVAGQVGRCAVGAQR